MIASVRGGDALFWAVIEGLDVVREAGPEVLLTRTLRHVRPDAHGKIHVAFAPRENFASLRAHEVMAG